MDTYAVIREVKYRIALVLDLPNKLPDEIVILNGDNVEGNLAFDVPKDAAIKRCHMTCDNSLTYNIEWIDRNISR